MWNLIFSVMIFLNGSGAISSATVDGGYTSQASCIAAGEKLIRDYKGQTNKNETPPRIIYSCNARTAQ